MPDSRVTIAGRANGTITASGNLLDEDQYFSLAGLSGDATFSELSFRVEDIQLNAETPLVVRFTPNEITFDQTRLTGPGTNIVLNGSLATGTGGNANLNVNGSLNLRVLNGISPDIFSEELQTLRFESMAHSKSPGSLEPRHSLTRQSPCCSETIAGQLQTYKRSTIHSQPGTDRLRLPARWVVVV